VISISSDDDNPDSEATDDEQPAPAIFTDALPPGGPPANDQWGLNKTDRWEAEAAVRREQKYRKKREKKAAKANAEENGHASPQSHKWY
jgi:hypothetical protein